MTPPDGTPPPDEADAFLSDAFIDMVHYVERFHAVNGEPPNDDQMHRRFNVAEALLEEFKVDLLVQKSLRARGINYPSPKDFLNERQLAAIASMTNYVDRRSDEKKLRDLGITAREWSTWLLDNNFSNYLQERAERMFTGSQHEAHLGLIKGMRNGNVASVKLFNEMSGRYNPDADHQLNIRMLLGGIIEILQLEIKDPIVLNRIATKMMNLAAREQQQSLPGGGIPGRYAPTIVEQRSIEMSGEL